MHRAISRPHSHYIRDLYKSTRTGEHANMPFATTPSNQADWESVKAVIGDLYLRDNLRLQDVIELMRETHKFRAT